jgi:hypothetical protein
MLKYSFLLVITFMVSCSRPAQEVTFSSSQVSKVMEKMTDIMVHDVTNPPLAARFFSYASLAGYEIVSKNNKQLKSMHGRLNEYPDIKVPDSISGYSYQLSAALAMMATAAKLQPSGHLMKAYEKQFIDSCVAAGINEDLLQNSKRYADYVSAEIMKYARSDNYNKISNYARYTSLETEGSWYPTPPAYIAAVEPNFNTVRPFTLDSASQFKPEPPVPFSKVKSSGFYKLMLQNYTDTLSQSEREVAAFWDCNPFAVQDNGHLLMSLKKISPGAHWLGITGIACAKAGKTFDESLYIHTVVSIGLMDAFICCWDEKYRSNRIRPETAIRKYIDPTWQPLLQTPPFPEYLSGHSTISAASETILTDFFGDHFSYTDDVEVSYGLPARNFASFSEASAEAGISRFYGGIHFMDAITNGNLQGKKAGAHVLSRLK